VLQILPFDPDIIE